MAESLELAPDLAPEVAAYLGYRTAADAICDPRGRLVRFTPWRRTVMHTLPDGRRIFCKFRHGHGSSARAEWAAMRELRAVGLDVPGPLFLARSGRASVLGMASVAGRPMDALLAAGQATATAVDAMPAVLRRLHAAGWVFRDMYWNHVFVTPTGGSIALIDVERAFRPRWRRRRWLVKDLAGLLASDPSGATRTQQLRFLRGYLGGLEDGWRELARAVFEKAERIRGHVTRYPG